MRETESPRNYFFRIIPPISNCIYNQSRDIHPSQIISRRSDYKQLKIPTFPYVSSAPTVVDVLTGTEDIELHLLSVVCLSLTSREVVLGCSKHYESSIQFYKGKVKKGFTTYVM